MADIRKGKCSDIIVGFYIDEKSYKEYLDFLNYVKKRDPTYEVTIRKLFHYICLYTNGKFIPIAKKDILYRFAMIEYNRLKRRFPDWS